MPQRTGLSYIKNVPRQLPKGGRVLVHNCVHAEWQDQKPGVNGFRCWTARIGRHSNMEPCDCGWSVCRIIVFPVRATKTRQT